MKELDDTKKEYAEKQLVLSAVQCDYVSSSNDAYSSDCTAKSAINTEESKKLLKLLLKDLALKIIKDTYDEYSKKDSPNLH